MNKDEIIAELINKGVIVAIADSYIITEKYKELLLLEQAQKTTLNVEVPKKPQSLNYDKLLNVGTSGDTWPETVLETTGRARCTALMDACQIPASVNTPSGLYRLRGVTIEVANIISNIVADPDIVPDVFISAVQLYYKNMERPKSFKNLVLEGEILDIYQEHLAGTFTKSFQSPSQDSTTSWG